MLQEIYQLFISESCSTESDFVVIDSPSSSSESSGKEFFHSPNFRFTVFASHLPNSIGGSTYSSLESRMLLGMIDEDLGQAKKGQL